MAAERGVQRELVTPSAALVGTSHRLPAHPAAAASRRPGVGWDGEGDGRSSPVFSGHCQGLWDALPPPMTLTCHGFKPHQEADQAGEADPAEAVAVPEGHQMQHIAAEGDSSKEFWGPQVNEDLVLESSQRPSKDTEDTALGTHQPSQSSDHSHLRGELLGHPGVASSPASVKPLSSDDLDKRPSSPPLTAGGLCVDAPSVGGSGPWKKEMQS
ncbi:hypothetical protein P7K49_028800 [Saguinus oedipus]|uniref:Uncharacterized protein n=1 Tax=Saguinus oedipus TaxID=9490 RepID=A0ABQ9U7E1_SAGOE|nr:hypothetical protein P7K49_028800 [Saguinus oedipus]